MASERSSNTATVVFSTYNGERTLGRMLEALCALQQPRRALQIIAVDNASSDQTPKVLRSFLDRLPLLLLHQPERGKNRALNLAIRHVQGDLVVFTDDDVLPNQDWLNTFERYADTQPEYDLFGGAIVPHWERPPEPWVLRSVPQGVAYAQTPPELRPGAINPGLIWGANMMVRKRVFDAGHRFNEDVGPSSGQYIMGSETEFNIRIANEGYRSWFCPDSRVQHIIRDFQMTEEWVIRRAYRFGRNLCLKEYTEQGPIAAQSFLFGLFNFPRWMLRRVVQDSISGYLWKLTRNQEKAVQLLWDAAFYRGYVTQAQALMKLHRHALRSRSIEREKA